MNLPQNWQWITMRSKAKANKEEETNKNYTSKGFVL